MKESNLVNSANLTKRAKWINYQSRVGTEQTGFSTILFRVILLTSPGVTRGCGRTDLVQ